MTGVLTCHSSTADLVGRKTFAGPGRKWGCICVHKRQRLEYHTSQAFSTEPSTKSPPEPQRTPSRLLKTRRPVSQPREQQGKAQWRQKEHAPESAKPLLNNRAPGRLLQRSGTSKDLAEFDKQRQQVRDTQQALDRQQASGRHDSMSRQRSSDPQQASEKQHSNSESTLSKQARRPDQQTAKPSGKRYSQAAGKLSRKDWQVLVPFAPC